MTDFSQIVTDWETFYLLTGTAAATLMGLLFVAVSINIEAFHEQARPDMQHFAALTFNCFFYALLVSILFLVPKLSPPGLGIPLLLLGGLGLANAMMQQRRARRIQINGRGTSIASRFTVPILCLAGLTIIGAGVILQITQSLYGLVPVIIFLLASASVNAWTLLVRRHDQAAVGTSQHK
jgi:hypothetical protein